MIDNSVSMQNSVSPTGAPLEAIDSARVVTNPPPHLATGFVQRRSPGQRLWAALTAPLPRNFPAFNLPSGGATVPSPYRVSSRALRLTVLFTALTVGLLFLLPGGPAWAQDAGTIEYPENGTGSVATYIADDPEGTATASWSLAGTDADAFTIVGGVLRFAKTPDYEVPADVVGTGGSSAAAGDNEYEITVEAMDSTGQDRHARSDSRGHRRGRGWHGDPLGAAAPGRRCLHRESGRP